MTFDHRYDVEVVDTSGDLRILQLYLDSYRNQSDAFLCVYSANDANSLAFLRGNSAPAPYVPSPEVLVVDTGVYVLVRRYLAADWRGPDPARADQLGGAGAGRRHRPTPMPAAA
jgi:hypothetical protein